VIGRPDEMKGQAVAAFVTLKGGFEESEALCTELRNHVGKVTGNVTTLEDPSIIENLQRKIAPHPAP
jgi:acetyl-CoA synthetase